MKRIAAMMVTVSLAAGALGAAPRSADTKTVTWTGWFSDVNCARGPVANGKIAPNGTACVKKCLEEGVAAGFISEQAKALYAVKDHPGVLEDVGFHVELTGVVDEEAKTISVRSVKRLSEVVNTCAVPQKKQK